MKDVAKSGWVSKPLGEVVEVIGGGTPSKRNPAFYGGEIPWATVRDMNLEHIAKTEHSITADALKASSSKLIPAGEVVIATRVGLGKACILDQDTAINQDLRGLVPKSSEQVDRRFLFHWYKSIANQIIAAGTGATVQGVKLPFIKGLPIPLPPLEEQRRIVAKLDEAFEGLDRARENAEVNLQNARDLFGSALHVAFEDGSISWNDTVLADLGSVVTGSTPKTSDKGNLGDHLPFVKPGDFLSNGSLVYDNQGLSEKGASVSRLLPAGSALMVCIGATIGKAGYSDRPIATNQQINAVVPNDGISGEYLYYQMLTPAFQADVMHGSGQATLPIINKGKWSKLTVRLPSDPTKQIEIVDKLSSLRAQIDATSAQYKAQIADIDDLRQSLLQNAFAGELT
ncbi:restriction endonuclease subunit S [Roseovarius dicentrarchi]|uniref:restriction endonuclease subunit S n=1 Tax=Roseovarius dicentrarchi TaxID=2250573 RepID=UPI000DE8F6CF|nr:restriction endonuclease subunit S [Roseovarius dicentrarchi]